MADRREKVTLILDDQFSTKMAKAAAAAALLDRNLESLDGSSVSSSRSQDVLGKSLKGVGTESEGASKKVKAYTLEMAIADEKSNRLRKSLRDEAKAFLDAADAASEHNKIVADSSREIDRYSGRLRLLGEAAVVLGPAFVPIGAAAVPALAGLTAGLGAAVGAVGVAVLAFDGMGDALESISDYRLEPTTENLEVMRLALAEVGPAGADFANFLADLAPALDQLQNTARAGIFPGVQEGIESLLPLLPQVERIVGNIATALGELAADAGDALASDRFEAFFNYLETDAGPTLEEFGHATGNVVEGLANLMVAFAPLSRDFSGGLEDMTRSFADWTAGLAETEGFQEFVAYVRTSGPQVLELLGSLGSALVGIAQAAAPFGQAVVPMLTAFADILGAIARSPIGPPLFTAAAGFLAVSRASNLAASGVARFNTAAAAGFGGAGFATKIAGVAAAFGILGNEFAKLNGSKVDLSELEGNLDAIANGGGAETIDHIVASIQTLQQGGPDAYEVPTLGGLFGNTPRDNALEYIESVDAQLAQLVASGNAEKAAKIFDQVMASLTGLPEGSSFAPFGETAETFDQYTKALDQLGPAAERAAKSQARTAAQVQRTRTEMIAARSAARGTAQGFITLGDSLDNSKKSLADWLREMEKQAAALRDFTQNARTAAKRGLNDGLIKSLNEAGPAGALRMKQLANATDSEIKRANKAWREGQQAIRDYVNMQVPPKKARVDNGQALSAIGQVRTALQQLRDRTVVVNMVYKRTAFDVATGSADGSTVPKSGLPYADRYPYMLADGEEVISNRFGQADRHRSLLKAINANRLADGGTTGIGTASFLSLSGMNLSEGARIFGSLKKFTAALEKATEAAEKDADAARDRVQAVRADIQSMRQSIAERFRSDLFGQQASSPVDIGAVEGGPTSAAQSLQWALAQQQVSQFMSQGQSPVDILRSDIAQAREAQRLYRQLRQAGLRGSALAYAQSNASNDELSALLSDPQMLRQYQRLYGVRQEVSTGAGQTAAMQRFGRAQEMAVAALVDARKELRESKQQLRLANRRLEQIEKNTKDAPKKTGDEVGKRVNEAATAGSRGRAY